MNIPNKKSSGSDNIHASSDASLFSNSLPVLPHKNHHPDGNSIKFVDDVDGDSNPFRRMLIGDEEELLDSLMDEPELLSGLLDSFEEDYDYLGSLETFSENDANSIAGEYPYGYGEHPSRTLFVRNINSNVDDSELRALFEQYGEIQNLYTACKSRGFVMISYYDIRASQVAIRALQNTMLRERQLDIHFSIPKDNPCEKDNEGTLIVFNLDSSVSNQDFKNIFGAYGEIKEILDRKHKKFVEFYDVRSADAAFKALNKSYIAGKCIKLEHSSVGGARRNMLLKSNPKSQQCDSRSYMNSPLTSSSSRNYFKSPIDYNLVQSFSNAPAFENLSATTSIPLPQHSSILRSQGAKTKKAAPATMAATDAQQLDSNVNQVDSKNQFQLDLSKVMNGEDLRTTLMIKNIPNKYTSEMLLAAINKKNRGTYDFLYFPFDLKNKCNMGYAFINMVSPEFIIPFYEDFHEKKWDNFNSGKVASLAYAWIQGKNTLVAHFQNSSSMNQDYSPIVFVGKSSNPTIMKSEKEMMGETECILVFSCNDKVDEDEISFIEAISNELQKRDITPLTYNLLGKENLDEEMLNRSSVGVMIFSKSYACSRQSLDHFMEVMEHGKATNLVIFPIYFKVTFSDIRGLDAQFEEAFLQYLDRTQKRKTNMAETPFFNGHDWTKETQVMLIDEVVEDTCLRLRLKSSKTLVSILAFLKHSQPLLADIVGLWGMAGIGKTSIAREVFGILAPQYDMCYFIQDFHLICQMKGVRQMRDDFFSKIFGEESLSISACDIKPSFMREWFQNKTILLVLDDVSNARDVEAVVGGFGWFSHGHRIILTSRRKQVLVQCKVKEPYEIQKLCKVESDRLCKLYLKEECLIIPELMNCSSGNPLALKVLSSSVSKEHINNMKENLQSLRRNPPTKIQEAFWRSFDGLDENEKNIFLDLSCFFQGENKDHVVQILDACGFQTYLGICNLIDESLVSLLDNRIKIPIPFQDMGRFIVHEEDEDPCERSRLWDSNDIASVLKNNSGTEAIECIFLDVSDLTSELRLSPTLFDKMYSLRLLKFYSSTSGNQSKLSLPEGLETLPDELRLLHWESYPLKHLPQQFNPENLVEVNMPYSELHKLWDGKKNLEKLKKIKLSHSRNLTDILMLSEALSLEDIDLEGCTSLVDVSTSILPCRKLVSLNMKDCSHLRSLPALVGLTSLKLLNLSGCSELEEIQHFAPNLKELYLAGTAIRELPLSNENLTELVTLDLENCTRLQHLPFGIRNSRSIVTSLRSLPKLEA